MRWNTQLFFTGLYALNHHALHVSPHYHVFRDDNPPTTAEYSFINELNRCERGIPLLAVMTYILLPNTSVRQDVHPAIRNSVTVLQQKKETQTPIETPITTSAGVSEAAIKASIVRLCVFSIFLKCLTQTLGFIDIRTP